MVGTGQPLPSLNRAAGSARAAQRRPPWDTGPGPNGTTARSLPHLGAVGRHPCLAYRRGILASRTGAATRAVTHGLEATGPAPYGQLMTDTDSLVEVTGEQELIDILGTPLPRVAGKDRPRLHEVDRRWLADSPLCLIATAASDGSCDVSPKGDPPGFALVLDDTTIAIPERPGNRRADGYRNILSNPHVGLIFLIPGRGDTLRINGRARLVRDAPFFDRMVLKGHRPVLALVVDIEQVFYHCSKAFLRSALWDAGTWQAQQAPPRPVIAKAVERPDEPLAALETYYGAGYGEHLYGT